MAREPGVALLMIAFGSQIKLEFETMKAQYFSRKLYLYVEWFRVHSRVGLNLAEEEKKKNV